MSFLVLFAALPICSIGTGLLVVRRLRWSRAEKLAAAVGASLVILYLVTFALFEAGAPARPSAWALFVLSLTAAIWARSELARFSACRSTRRILLGFATIFAAVLLFSASIRTFSGGGWYRDWYEQFERAHVFLDRVTPIKAALEGGSPLPARPPLMNVVAAHFLALGDGSFATYQVVAGWLSALAFLSGALMLGAWGHRDRRSFGLFACLLLLNPSFIQNATYPWTKLASAFFVLLGTFLYFRGWRKNDASRIVAGAGALAAASLVHYSAVPYGIFLAVHYLSSLVWRTQRRRRLELLGSLAGAGLLVASWIVWSDHTFSPMATVASNTTWQEAASLTPRQNFKKIERNLVNTLVPHPLRVPAAETREFLGNTGSIGYVHDYFFLLYQHSALPAMGLVGGLVAFALWLSETWRARERRTGRSSAVARFWCGSLVASFVIGIAAFPELDLYGLVHIALQPITLVGLGFLASRLARLPMWTRVCVLAGAAIDATLGIALHFWAQARDVARVATANGLPAANEWALAHSGSRALRNTGLKLKHQLDYLGDLATIPGTLLQSLLALLLLAALAALARQVFWPNPIARPKAIARARPAGGSG